MQFKAKIIAALMMSLVSACSSTRGGYNQVLASNEQQNETVASDDQQAMRPKSEIAKINAQLGIAYLEKKNVQRAKQKLLLALEQGPNIPEPWYSMAYFLEATGNKAEASKYYMKSIEVAPQRGDAQNNYGTFLCRNGQYQESIKHFMAAANSPEYLDPAAAYENAGLCSMKMNAYSQASTYFNQALLKDPARTLSLLKLAEVNIKLKKYEEAQHVLTQYAMVASPIPEYKMLSEQLAKETASKTG